MAGAHRLGSLTIGHASARVDHVEADGSRGRGRAGEARRADCHLPRVGELHGVDEQVEKDPHEARAVATQERRHKRVGERL
eukprot:251739-Prymnesium_polylepis.1